MVGGVAAGDCTGTRGSTGARRGGGLVQPSNSPSATALAPNWHACAMQWLLIEIVLVLAILAGLVWWTMFSGRPRDESAAGSSGEAAEADERKPRP
ncbi:MAG: hypothetical protein AMXMBFR78_24430 [Rubrivivax sp.]